MHVWRRRRDSELSLEELARRCVLNHPDAWALDAPLELRRLAGEQGHELGLVEATDLLDVARGIPIDPYTAKLRAGADKRPFHHAELFARELTAGTERLRVGGGEDSPQVLAILASLLAEPLWLLVVNRGRVGAEGRYESTPKSLAEVLEFVAEYHDLFAHDSRVDLWIGSVATDGLLVLDEHDFIFAYGDLDAFAAELRAHGHRDGSIELPFPHVHRFLDEFDPLEASLVSRPDWNRVLPLQEVDRS